MRMRRHYEYTPLFATLNHFGILWNKSCIRIHTIDSECFGVCLGKFFEFALKLIHCMHLCIQLIVVESFNLKTHQINVPFRDILFSSSYFIWIKQHLQ